MGHNRGGDNRRSRMKRRRREVTRLTRRSATHSDQTGIVHKIKEAAKGAINAVEKTVAKVVHGSGKGEGNKSKPAQNKTN